MSDFTPDLFWGDSFEGGYDKGDDGLILADFRGSSQSLVVDAGTRPSVRP